MTNTTKCEKYFAIIFALIFTINSLRTLEDLKIGLSVSRKVKSNSLTRLLVEITGVKHPRNMHLGSLGDSLKLPTQTFNV